ncbi:tankyrase 1 binding protein 1 [Planoprotostelium fungivorum]|uniref:Tankyrase 1 binding protein 1 n=1 Tax=Planoprotostelium fungivorum TaxID=1890364 RepID=A0A2P6N8A4_9EUKA|nr:tankyrase 1 binding protein 1 [Planoprotostelium fungivorum]
MTDKNFMLHLVSQLEESDRCAEQMTNRLKTEVNSQKIAMKRMEDELQHCKRERDSIFESLQKLQTNLTTLSDNQGQLYQLQGESSADERKKSAKEIEEYRGRVELLDSEKEFQRKTLTDVSAMNRKIQSIEEQLTLKDIKLKHLEEETASRDRQRVEKIISLETLLRDKDKEYQSFRRETAEKDRRIAQERQTEKLKYEEHLLHLSTVAQGQADTTPEPRRMKTMRRT